MAGMVKEADQLLPQLSYFQISIWKSRYPFIKFKGEYIRFVDIKYFLFEIQPQNQSILQPESLHALL